MSANDSTPTLAQADTVLAGETPPSPVDAGGPDIAALFDDPRYRGGALLGQGGMGEVRLYRDRRLGREVAVKVLRPGAGSVGVRRQRFVREARVQGQLEHPSVVPVYDLEMDAEGEARITMKRVRGQTLEAVILGLAGADPALQKRFSRRRLLTAFVSVCQALDYAHARGIVHRDVKPANVMLGEFGEVHLLDWGIAKVLGASATDDPVERTARDLTSPTDISGDATIDATPPFPGQSGTAEGALLGTPGYMSPEQARGENATLDARSDVFALGAMLYEILTLTPMFPGHTFRERLSAAIRGGSGRSAAAEAPDADIPPELDQAVIKATAPRREDRYSTAGALAEAVDRYLDGDRDLAARKALASEHVEEARAMLQKADGHDDEGELRSGAVRTLARAVALDPHHPEASALLGQLLVEAPKKLPREAAAELEAAHRAAQRTAARAGVARVAGVFGVSAVALWMGVRRPWLGAAGALMLLGAGLLSLLWVSAATERRREIVRMATLVLSFSSLTVLSYILGPSILVPALCMANGIVLLGQADFRSPRVVILASLVPLLWRFFAGFLGIAPMPYQVTLDQVVIPAELVSFPPVTTLALLAVSGVLQVAVPLLVLAVARDRLRTMEERLFLHSYHLRRLASSPSL